MSLVLRRTRWLCAVAAIVATPALAAPSYVAVPLGTLGGPTSFPAAINDSGKIAGLSYLPLIDPAAPPGQPGNAVVHAVVDVNGTLRDLGINPKGTSQATGINASGQMTVVARDLPGSTGALLVTDGIVVDVGPPGSEAWATALNNAGTVVGSAAIGGVDHAFLYANGAVADLHSIGVGSAASAVNATGQVTGIVSFSTNGQAIDRQYAFLYDSGSMHLLGENEAGNSSGMAINDSGQVAAWLLRFEWNGLHAVLFGAMGMTDLGTLGGQNSVPLGINNAGWVVGASDIAGANGNHAFLHDGTQMHDLNALVVSGLDGAVLTQAHDINEKNQVVATACIDVGMCQAFRLDPLPPGGGTKVAVIEFYHAGMGHYFLTADPVEANALDTGVFAGWTRTGETFAMLADPVAGAAPLCRFFSAAFAPKGSHFFTPATSECVWVNGNPRWQFEGVRLYVKRPQPDGSCPAGTKALYRVFNNGQGGAPAHRYTTSAAIRDQMKAAGWLQEGVGAEGVEMCVPL
jgi:probable HAF family extracellular repeat protein